MIILDVKQGTVPWVQARLGIPTASQFYRIVTPARLDYAKASEKYLLELLAEWATGHELEAWTSPWADRGKKLEPEARRAYAFERGAEVQAVGFVYRDEERDCGASPDGLVGDPGGLELKCPAAKTHIEYLLDPSRLVDRCALQVHGGLWVTGREWWDCMSYFPGMPPVIERVERDGRILGALDEHVPRFLEQLEDGKRRLLEAGVVPRLGDDPTELPEWALPSVDHLQPEPAAP